MFNLEQAIADWRRELVAGGLGSSEVIDELESHLRDDMEQQPCGNSDEEQAFQMAVQQIGQAAVLEPEFKKVAGLRRAQQRLKVAFLTLAGIPNHQQPSPMNPSHPNVEPRWATYLKAVTFLGPALFLWTLAAVFVLPKLQQICAEAGLAAPNSFWNVTSSNFTIMLFFKEYGPIICGAVVLALVLLEWRSNAWPRYRRAALGAGAFVFNSVVLISIFLMILTATVAAPALLHHAK
jgi:hypothetical protein